MRCVTCTIASHGGILPYLEGMTNSVIYADTNQHLWLRKLRFVHAKIEIAVSGGAQLKTKVTRLLHKRLNNLCLLISCWKHYVFVKKVLSQLKYLENTPSNAHLLVRGDTLVPLPFSRKGLPFFRGTGVGILSWTTSRGSSSRDSKFVSPGRGAGQSVLNGNTPAVGIADGCVQ